MRLRWGRPKWGWVEKGPLFFIIIPKKAKIKIEKNRKKIFFGVEKNRKKSKKISPKIFSEKHFPPKIYPQISLYRSFQKNKMFSRNNSKLIKKSSMSRRRRVVPLNPGPLSLDFGDDVQLAPLSDAETEVETEDSDTDDDIIEIGLKREPYAPADAKSGPGGWYQDILYPGHIPAKTIIPAGAYMVDDDTDTDIDFVTPKKDGRHQVQDDVETDSDDDGSLKYHQAAKKRIAVRQLVDVEDSDEDDDGSIKYAEKKNRGNKVVRYCFVFNNPKCTGAQFKAFWKRSQKSN